MIKLFRELEDSSEIGEFQKWARDNYLPNSPIDGCWHPIVQMECVRMMHVERLNKQELLSHTAELVSSQDKQIHNLLQQRQALIALIAIVFVLSVL